MVQKFTKNSGSSGDSAGCLRVTFSWGLLWNARRHFWPWHTSCSTSKWTEHHHHQLRVDLGRFALNLQSTSRKLPDKVSDLKLCLVPVYLFIALPPKIWLSVNFSNKKSGKYQICLGELELKLQVLPKNSDDAILHKCPHGTNCSQLDIEGNSSHQRKTFPRHIWSPGLLLLPYSGLQHAASGW